MRKLSDTGLSANTRYANSTVVHGTILSSSKQIRFFADYNKCIKVMNSKFKIEAKVDGKSERLWFTIWDDKIKYRYNGIHVRVRMAMGETSVAYLFDVETDTYLGFMLRDYEPAGDLANQTEQDRNYMYKHSAMLKRQDKDRVTTKNNLLEELDSAETEREVHESLRAPLLLTDKNKRQIEFTNDIETNESNEPNHEQSFVDVAENQSDEYIPELETVSHGSISEEELEASYENE